MNTVKYSSTIDRADYMEDEQIQLVLKYQPEWTTQLKEWKDQVCNVLNQIDIIITCCIEQCIYVSEFLLNCLYESLL